MINATELKPSSKYIEQIKEMDNDLFDRPWSEKSWSNILTNENYSTFILLDHESLIGFSVFFLPNKESQAHLLKIFILKSYRSKGYSKLLLFPELALSSIYLEVDTKNLAARKFYQKHGFFLLEITRNYYSDGSDAAKMIKKF
jgi:ribosomal-protein-alanine N-acetyltransferase